MASRTAGSALGWNIITLLVDLRHRKGDSGMGAAHPFRNKKEGSEADPPLRRRLWPKHYAGGWYSPSRKVLAFPPLSQECSIPSCEASKKCTGHP